jgi:flagellar basal-body rod protein FlgC
MSAFRMFDIAGSALSAQSLRLNLTASNLANISNVSGDPADVYRAKHAVFRAADEPFAAALDRAAAVQVLGVVESTAAPVERYDPGHPEADANGIVYAAAVSPMEEMANMISASRSYQSNLEVVNTAKDLLLRTLALGQG